MLQNETIAFVGSGVIAQAMIAGLINQNLVDPQRIIASGPRKERGEELTRRYGIRHTTNNIEAVQNVDIIVLSVKPQIIDEVMEEIAGHIPADVLVMSIVAGAPIQKISAKLTHQTIVRVMPNTPARVGKGMSVWTATHTVSDAQKEHARTILKALGEEIFVDHEYFLDMATALSGSGPAYVFLFIEALIDSGVHMGFSRRVAQELVLQTVEGAVTFARQYQRHPVELRNMVTSPGGTTADALYQLEKGGFRTIISKAVFAAYQKSKFLGGNQS
ncbi:MAG: pyrroline-5-carboxylate reductase [Anaerolineae bacterium]